MAKLHNNNQTSPKLVEGQQQVVQEIRMQQQLQELRPPLIRQPTTMISGTMWLTTGRRLLGRRMVPGPHPRAHPTPMPLLATLLKPADPPLPAGLTALLIR